MPSPWDPIAVTPDALRRARSWLSIFLIGLVASGVTAFPLNWELNLLARLLAIPDGVDPATLSGLQQWVATVRDGVAATGTRYPFLAYGTDWLAYGHLAIAALFVPAWRDPVRMRPMLVAGLWICGGVLPIALLFGPLRGIPFYWRLIDCAFGVVGAIPLLLALRLLPEPSVSRAP